jgi:hypothetical protein
MIYIVIPEGWTFEGKKKLPEEIRSTLHPFDGIIPTEMDCLVNEEGKIILLQDLIKDALRRKKPEVAKIETNDASTHGALITIYFKSPGLTHLQYEPKNNGKFCSDKAVLVDKTPSKKEEVKPSSYVGTLWFQRLDKPLSKEALAAAIAHAADQRDNRRGIHL